MKIYDLMHNNEIVAIVQMSDIGKLEKAVIKTPELVPPQGKLSIQDLQKWWERRAVPITQGNIKFLLRQLNIDSPSEFLYQNLGLSLIDHYWIRPNNSSLSWEDVNLYQNNFKDITDTTDQFSNKDKRIVYTPASSLSGELKKKWIMGKNNVRYLIKENASYVCSGI